MLAGGNRQGCSRCGGFGGQLPAAQLLLDPLTAGHFGDGFLTQVAAFAEAQPLPQAEFKGIGLSVEFSGGEGQSQP